MSGTSHRRRKGVRGSASGRPIMALLDLLGRRWTLRILWEMRAGAMTFRVLQERCGVSPTVLNSRLRELRDAGLVEHGETGYVYTPWGADLVDQLIMLDAWSKRWARLAGPRF